jgi:hypothetical protein
MTNNTEAKVAAADFFRYNSADNIVYALNRPGYFGLDEATVVELHTLVFAAINKAKA